MPPRRKAATPATRAQTLHSFSTVGKNILKSGKPTRKARIITETKKKEEVKAKIELVPAFEIKQDGDEDVVIRREKPAKAELAVDPKLAKGSPKKPTSKVEPAAEAESVKVSPRKSTARVEPSVETQPVKVLLKKTTTSPATKTPRGKRKRTLHDEFVSSPAKKREIKPLKETRPLTPPPTSSPADTEADYPPATASESSALPGDLKLLQSLHSSLLTALLLHRAHHSSSIQPPVFSAIKLHVERLCRRNITIEDVRKIVYLSHYSNDPKESDEHWEKEGGLKLIDYGDGKICIDFAEKTRARKLVNSDNLKNDFASRTRAFWETTNTLAPPSAAVLPTPPSSFVVPPELEDETEEIEEKPEVKPEDIAIPMSTIPLAKIHAHPKAATIAKVLHTKGQQRLDDMLRRHQPAVPPVAKSSSRAPPAKRGSSLLDRIRAKAAIAAEAAGKALSKEETERVAAEQRIPDIEPILKGLAGRGSNMTMKAVVEGIRESVRNPVSSEQAEIAVRLIAKREGDDGWVKVREVGKVVGVVFGKRAEDGEFL